MIIIGLSVSIGMGKSTTAAMFRDCGVAVHDSDQAVHNLYNGPEASRIEAAFPGVVVKGKVDRWLLSGIVLFDPERLRVLEAIVHPFVAEDRDAFVSGERARNSHEVLIDVPLLFETGAAANVDVIVVVTASANVQRERVLSRPGMSVERFEAILAKQMSDSEKRRRAHFVIHTDMGLTAARQEVRACLKALGLSRSASGELLCVK